MTNKKKNYCETVWRENINIVDMHQWKCVILKIYIMDVAKHPNKKMTENEQLRWYFLYSIVSKRFLYTKINDSVTHYIANFRLLFCLHNSIPQYATIRWSHFFILKGAEEVKDSVHLIHALFEQLQTAGIVITRNEFVLGLWW